MGLVAVIDDAGITAPSYAEILEELQDLFRGIYGSDVLLDPDTADGQFLAIFASVVNDANQAAVAAYNAFSPIFAQGAGLSSVVKINGIRRRASTHSTADVTIGGTVGTEITNGRVQDQAGRLWNLPATVIIGGGGTVVATATCEEDGAITAGIGDINIIATPTRGWQTVTNADPAEVGAAVETDAQLRRRQNDSVAMPAQSIVPAISAAIGDVEGVTRHFVYENDTDAPDGDGLPAHSIAAVVEGGDNQDIGEAIAGRKPPGIQTFGDVDVTVIDSRGVPREIHFLNLVPVPIAVEVTIDALGGYVSSTEDKIKAAVALFLNRLSIGEDSYLGRLFNPAGLQGQAAIDATGLSQADLDALAETFSVTTIKQSRDGDPVAAANVAIAFDEAASGVVADVTVVTV